MVSCLSRNLSTAYPDHGVNRDLNSFLTVYPETIGSPLDDCGLCHRRGSDSRTESTSCDGCHEIYLRRGFRATLNAYGMVYMDRGRSVRAIRRIAEEDADSDGYSNHDEIVKLCFPGEVQSHPDQVVMPSVRLNSADLNSLPRHRQFILMNAHRHNDYYVTYAGWRMDHILHRAGVKTYTGITVISWDGFKKYYPADAFQAIYPSAVYYGPDQFVASHPDCAQWLRYPDSLPPGLSSGEPIPGEPRIILAAQRDDRLLQPLGRGIDGRLRGEGPYRLVVPQRDAAGPDQSMAENNPGCPFPFREEIHHNSGDSVRGVVALLVHPAPAGMREVDWRSQADGLLSLRELLIFGNIHSIGGVK